MIHKKNGGLSDARNAGLEVCTGGFISFIDSDDWIELNTYEIMMINMKKYNADIVVSNINYVYEDKIECKYSEEKIHIFNKEETMNEIIKDGLVQSVVWNKLYKKEIIDDMKFKVGKLNEDEYITYKVCARTERVVYIPNTLYQYCQRENSIMSTYTLKRLDGVEALYERLQFIKLNFPNLYNDEKIEFCNTCIYNYQMLLKSNINDKDARKKLIEYRKEIHFRMKDLENIKIQQKIYLLISKISLDLCCRLKNKLQIGY